RDRGIDLAVEQVSDDPLQIPFRRELSEVFPRDDRLSAADVISNDAADLERGPVHGVSGVDRDGVVGDQDGLDSRKGEQVRGQWRRRSLHGSLSSRETCADRGGRHVFRSARPQSRSMFEKRRLRRGLTALQAVLTVASAATALSVTTLPLHRALRQARLHGAVRGVYSVVVTARMEAMRGSQPVVVSADSSRRRVLCWADEGPY